MTGGGSARVVLALAASLAAGAPATAQMQLPGALNGNAPGAPPPAAGGGSAGGPTPAPPRPVVIKPPADDTILGHTLSRDGKSGTMIFDKSAEGLTVQKLTLEGDKISRPQDVCSVDVSMTTPLVAKPSGRPAGAIRYAVALEACPFTLDVLDGAVLVSTEAPSCDFKAADCRVSPAGLWGPRAADISPKQAKDLERQRPRIETTMRTNYKVLIRKAGKDRAAVKALAREQAAFSSEREMTCRDYDQEPVHGFCSTQITQARALALLARFGPIDDKSAHRGTKAKPKVAAPPAAAAPPAPEADAPQ